MRIQIRILDFDMKNIPYVCNMKLKHSYVGTKAILKGWKSGLFVDLVNFLAPGSGRIYHTDPDQDPE
jgi:hypothetical protein